MKRDVRSTRCVRRLNQRQRKKLRVAEFTEYVFEVELKFGQALDGKSYDRFIDDLSGFLEQRGLLGGAFGGHMPLTETSGVITTVERGSPAEEDRDAVEQWLRARSEVAQVRVLELSDGWHGSSR